MGDRRRDLDFLKGLAIIAVILYHFGFLTYGYLGVDLFLVINGYLITKGLILKSKQGSLSYIDFFVKRFSRLYPLVILAGAISLILGYISMLPDNFENLAQSVVASNFFSNNILADITTKNYWDVVNNYKPLMHFWYVGIVAEFYVIYPLFFIIPQKLKAKGKNFDALKCSWIWIAVFTFISFVLYVVYKPQHFSKFYCIAFRFYELAEGGLIAFLVNSGYKKFKAQKPITLVTLILLIILNVINYEFIPDSVRLVSVVVLSCIAVLGCDEFRGDFIEKILHNKFIVTLGEKSYSYFVWHQVILAFYRSYISTDISVVATIICLALIIIVSEISYYFVEKKIKANKKTLIWCMVFAVIISVLSGMVYIRAGVIRDVPELGISTDSVQRSMHAQYCDRIYSYDKDFPDNDRINVLIIGNSFARDWANILLESEMRDKINISYSYDDKEELAPRVAQSDYVFIYADKPQISDYLLENIDRRFIYGIGTKNFGENNDTIYLKRFRRDYFETKIKPDEEIVERNEEQEQFWGETFINLLDLVKDEHGMVRVFTDDGKFISQDCRHLTQFGAKYYASIVDFESIFFAVK